MSTGKTYRPGYFSPQAAFPEKSKTVPENIPVESGWYWGQRNGEWRIVSVHIGGQPSHVDIWDGDYLCYLEEFDRFSDRLLSPDEVSGL